MYPKMCGGQFKENKAPAELPLAPWPPGAPTTRAKCRAAGRASDGTILRLAILFGSTGCVLVCRCKRHHQVGRPNQVLGLQLVRARASRGSSSIQWLANIIAMKIPKEHVDTSSSASLGTGRHRAQAKLAWTTLMPLLRQPPGWLGGEREFFPFGPAQLIPASVSSVQAACQQEIENKPNN